VLELGTGEKVKDKDQLVTLFQQKKGVAHIMSNRSIQSSH